MILAEGGWETHRNVTERTEEAADTKTPKGENPKK